MRRILRCVAFLSLCLSSIPAAYAANGHISVGDPTENGSVTIDVTIPGIIPSGGDTTTRIKVDGIKATDTAAQKAVKIANKINSVYGAPPNVATINAGNNARIDLVAPSGPKAGHAGAAVVVRDRTKEGTAFASIQSFDSDLNLYAFGGFDSMIAGIDANGRASRFGMGFGNSFFDIFVELDFQDLVNPTIDDLLKQTHGLLLVALPEELRPRLSLMLFEHMIRFEFADGDTGYYARTTTTDVGTDVLGGLSYEPNHVPEPAMFGLLGIGLLLTATLRSRR